MPGIIIRYSIMIKTWFITGLFLFQLRPVHAQQIHMVSMGNPSSLRGLCAVNDRIIWVSGSEGTVGVSRDGGISWKWITILHYEKTDFRDVEAFSEQEAVIMGITDPAVILKTRRRRFLDFCFERYKSRFISGCDGFLRK
jgi:hypothetical protein